jgi:hypothetical protein
MGTTLFSQAKPPPLVYPPSQIHVKHSLLYPDFPKAYTYVDHNTY